MDNKNDKKFYWEVKDFLNKSHQLNESVAKNPDTLKDSIKKMLVQGNLLHQPKPTNQQVVDELLSLSEDTVKNVVNFIDNSEVEVNKGKSDCKAFTSNITENLFSVQKKNLLTEQPVGLGGGGSFGGGGSSSRVDAARQRREEALAAANSRREAERAEKAKQKAQRERERAEDEAYQFNKEIEAEEQANKQQAAAKRAQAGESDIEQMRRTAEEQGGVPAEAVTSAETLRLRQEAERQGGIADQTTDQERRIAAEQEKANKLKAEAQAMEKGTGRARLQMQTDDPNTPEDESLLPANTPANRAALRSYRQEKSRARTADMLSKDLERLRGKDVSQLTDLEKVKLRLAQQRLSSDSEMAERVKKLTTRGGPVPQGPTPSGGNLGDDEDLVGRALNLTKDQTQIARARRVDDTDSDERISGSSMSYGQFYNLTGRKYDAFSDLDRKIVINMAGGGKLTPGNYNPNQMSQGEAGFMTGANYAFRANERERTANAAAFRQQDAAAKQRELENTPEYKEAQRKQAAQNRANLEAEVEGDLAKEYGVDTETIRRARTAGVNPRDLANQSQQSRPSPIQQTQSVVSSFKAPAAMQNQMTQSPRTSMVPGSKSFIDAQLRKMRGI